MMRSLIGYLTFLFQVSFLIYGNVALSKDSVRFIETTGRAVIDEQELGTSRRRALEDALYLAALHGGAKISGFSSVDTDTSIKENLVVQPDSQILDFNIISEEQSETHFVIKIRSAVGKLKNSGCENKGLKSVSVYKPEILIYPNVPYWAHSLSENLVESFMTSLRSENNLNITDYSDVFLNSSDLKSTNDEFDYVSLTSGRSKTGYGDYAIVPTIKISTSTKLVGFTSYDSLQVDLATNVYEGANYSLNLSKSKSFEVLFNTSGPWRTINLLLKSSRESVVEPILSKATEHSSDIINELICKKIHSIMAVKNGKIEVPLGKRHGIALSALAVTKGDQTPFNILSVEQVSENRSVLIPLNNTVEIYKFNGKSVQFLGKM